VRAFASVLIAGYKPAETRQHTQDVLGVDLALTMLTTPYCSWNARMEALLRLLLDDPTVEAQCFVPCSIRSLMDSFESARDVSFPSTVEALRQKAHGRDAAPQRASTCVA
jgi:hypothetical protein